MDANLSLDAIKHTRRFDGTLFQNWKHSMEILFEFQDIKDLVDVSQYKRLKNQLHSIVTHFLSSLLYNTGKRVMS